MVSLTLCSFFGPPYSGVQFVKLAMCWNIVVFSRLTIGEIFGLFAAIDDDEGRINFSVALSPKTTRTKGRDGAGKLFIGRKLSSI